MSGVGDAARNSVSVKYDAIVTPVSKAVTNTGIAAVPVRRGVGHLMILLQIASFLQFTSSRGLSSRLRLCRREKP